MRPGGSPRPVPRSPGHPPADPQSVPWMKPKTPPPKQSCAAWDPRPASQGGGAVGGTSATPVTCSLCFLPSPGLGGGGPTCLHRTTGSVSGARLPRTDPQAAGVQRGLFKEGGTGSALSQSPLPLRDPRGRDREDRIPTPPGCSRFVWKPPRGTPRSQAPPPCPVSPFGPGATVTSIQAQ